MSRSSLERAIPAGAAILLDTSVVVAYLDGSEAVSPVATVVIDEYVRSGRNSAMLSVVSVTEILVRPFAAGPAALALGEAFLLHSPNLEVVPVDLPIAREAARLRADRGLKTPDALILATAALAHVDVVVSNDERWRTAMGLGDASPVLCHLDEHLPL